MMQAKKKVRLEALTELIKKMRKLETADAFTKDGVGPSTDEMADEEEDGIEDDDTDVMMPKSLAMGKVAGSSDEGSEDDDEELRDRKAYMKRSNQAPVKGKTKMITISVQTKPVGKMGKMK